MRKVFIGNTSYQKVVFDVAKYSIETRSQDVECYPIDRNALETLNIYKRAKTSKESTEFSFTRFLTPWLAGYKGWVLFVDNDIVCLDDINKVFDLVDEKYAVMCVKHNYKPKSTVKLDNQIQTDYPRKNWSSLVLWNCSHPKNQILTPELINNVSGLYLHRFLWLESEDIGSIPIEWNYLAGQNTSIEPKLVHYTEGGPYFKNYTDCEYAEFWRDEYRSMTGLEFTDMDIIDA